MSDYLESRIYELETQIQELEHQIRLMKDLIPDNLKRRLKELESKTDDIQDAIDGLENS